MVLLLWIEEGTPVLALLSDEVLPAILAEMFLVVARAKAFQFHCGGKCAGDRRYCPEPSSPLPVANSMVVPTHWIKLIFCDPAPRIDVDKPRNSICNGRINPLMNLDKKYQASDFSGAFGMVFGDGALLKFLFAAHENEPRLAVPSCHGI